MSKKLDITSIQSAVKRLATSYQKYAGFTFLVAILLIYTFLVFRIGTLAQSEPTDEQVNEQLKTVKRLKIDQNSIDKIQQLQDQNIGVQSLFQNARDNPFQDK